MRIYYQARSLYGSYKGLAALLSGRDGRERPMTFEEFVKLLPEVLGPHHNVVVWYADVNRRLRALRLGQW
jgi:hypothetical protein